MTPFVREAQLLMAARIDAKTVAEKEDAEWALTYLFQMNKAGRLDEYLAQIAVRHQGGGTPTEPRG